MDLDPHSEIATSPLIREKIFILQNFESISLIIIATDSYVPDFKNTCANSVTLELLYGIIHNHELECYTYIMSQYNNTNIQ